MKTDRALLDLNSLIEFASAQVEKLFRARGEILPMYHAIKSSGETLVLTPPGIGKDEDVALIKAAFVLNEIDRYVFIDEAWILDTKSIGAPLDMKRIAREGVRNHPDRREVVMFAAENRRGEMLLGKRFILRPEHGKPSLSPLIIDDRTDGNNSGRMVGLLPKENER